MLSMLRRPPVLLAGGLGLLLLRRWQHLQGLRILRVSRVVADLDRAEAFYRDGLGFHRTDAGPLDAGLVALMGLPGATAEQVVMRLGAQEIALVRFDPAGRPYPSGSRTNDLWFQHLAIVVSDMSAACLRLQPYETVPISTRGPETLPSRNGGVVAFKFRDPDGHPLELIHFPPGQGREIWQQPDGAGPFLGIDHSALSVADTARSLVFYRGLGFHVAGRSLNYGEPQSRMDGLPDARAHVTGLRPAADGGMGLELLGYMPPGRPAPPTAVNALATDWVTLLAPGLRRRGMLLADGRRAAVRRDPDGHVMLLVDRA